MIEGLEVTIRYRGAKHDQVATPTTASSEFAILKKDLAHLRVHSPSQKNVRRVGGSFILHWPGAGASAKVAGLADSLHTRWFKLCSDDPEALKLRDFLSIKSIAMVQDGVLIRSTAGLSLKDVPQGALVEGILVGGHLADLAQQPGPLPLSGPPAKPPPPVIPPPRVPPTAPRSDRQSPPHLKRRMSDAKDSGSQTRQKLDVPETPTTTPLQSIGAQPQPQPQPSQPPTSPETDHRPVSPATADVLQTSPQPMQHDATIVIPSIHAEVASDPIPPDTEMIPPSPNREPGEMTPQAKASSPAPPITSPTSHPGPGPGPTQDARPPAPNHPSPYTLRPASPYASSSSSGNGEHYAPRRRDRDVNRLMRELWDTRRQLTAIQAREQVIQDDLERLGTRPENVGRADRSSDGVSRDEMMRLQADLRMEKARRTRAERVLSDVERECRAPFVVPALFQAFLSISELSN